MLENDECMELCTVSMTTPTILPLANMALQPDPALAAHSAGPGISQRASHWEPHVGAQHLPLLLNAGTARHSLDPSHPSVKPEVDYLVIYIQM